MGWLSEFLFSDGGYSPHGFCISWNTPVLFTHITADVMIAVSYFAIPAVILVFLKQRKDSRLHKPAMLFVIFITACGVSHLMSIVTMYLPYYGLQGIMKLFTGIVSFFTAVALWRMLPGALRIPTPEQLMRALDDKDDEIARRKKAQAEIQSSRALLAQKVEELEAANAELREFAYAASHDLKSPANTLSLWLDEFALDCEGKLEPEMQQEIVDAKRIIARMRQLVDDILAYSGLVSHDPSAVTTCDMPRLVQEVLEALRAEIATAEAQITVGPLPMIQGHPPMLSVLLQNLVANAVKFRDPNRPLRITITGRAETDRVILSVKDTGIGIAPQHTDRIFKLFSRLHHDTEYEGTGLGLALCRRIAAMHRGHIKVVSAEGVGTEFRITLMQDKTHVSQAA